MGTKVFVGRSAADFGIVLERIEFSGTRRKTFDCCHQLAFSFFFFKIYD